MKRPSESVYIEMQLARSFRRLSVLSAHLDTGKYDYDLIVIGGGSGGLACSKEAAALGKKVAVLDYVLPSPQGSLWGLGGTCVNVGCIPKKLMHQAALLGQAIKDSRHYGWSVPDPISHSWTSLRSAVNNHIKSLNWGHRVQLQKKNVDYFNAMGTFIDPHTIEGVTGEEKLKMTSKYFVIAVGGRPLYPTDVPGAKDFGITSDDLFSLKEPPGKTLVVGASYVALECAGFLASLGFDTSLMIRSTPLKSFDQDLVSLVVKHMEEEGSVRVMRRCEPREVKKRDDGRLQVVLYDAQDNQILEGDWDTILFATGRRACTEGLGLSELGIRVDSNTQKILTDNRDSTDCDNIFAIGDAADNRWELTPVAIKAGKMLAHRLFSDSQNLMDYDLVPTTVFTPLELSAIGLTEDQAITLYGRDSVEVYHAFYTPLEFYLPQRAAGHCYIKMVCLKGGNEKVLGLHLTAPNAGEITQGFSLAMRQDLTRVDLESSIGIHPTCAEEVVKLHITKSSGEDPNVTGC